VSKSPISEVYTRPRLINFIKRHQDRLQLEAAGSNTQIQFNDGGVFGASSNLTFEGSILNCTASVGIEVGSGGVHIGGDDGVTLFEVLPAGSSGVASFAIVETDVGFSTNAPKIHLDVNHGYLDWLSSDTGGGDWVTFGTGTTVAGKLYYLETSGVWTETDADHASGKAGDWQLLGIALGTDPSVNGMLLRGFFQMTTYLVGSWAAGQALYVSTTAANIAAAAPSVTGDFVRVVGYCCAGTTDLIYFNPSSTNIVIS
jgi:hypothetical protein